MRYRVRARGNPGRGARRGKTKLEQRYEQEVLALQLAAGEIAGYRYESVKLRLADLTWYTPDYEVMSPDGTLAYHEVKGGHWEDDARVKVKVVVEQYPERDFLEVTWAKQQWHIVPMGRPHEPN